MNVQDGDGSVHHLVSETQRLLCGRSEDVSDWQGSVTTAQVTCPACARILADDVRRAGPSAYDSED